MNPAGIFGKKEIEMVFNWIKNECSINSSSENRPSSSKSERSKLFMNEIVSDGTLLV